MGFFKSEMKLARAFSIIFRLIDGVLSLNNSKLGDNVDNIYPIELEIMNTTYTSSLLRAFTGSGWLNELGSWITNSYKPITNTAWVRARLCKWQKGCTRLAAASDKVCQLLAHGRWFSPGTPASSTTKTGRHDIAEILLKVALNTKNQSINRALTYTRIDSAGRKRLKLYEKIKIWYQFSHWRTFHLYVATFQRLQQMECISLSWYDIPELASPIRNPLIDECCYQGSFWTKGS